MTRQSSAHNEDGGTASTSAVPHVAPRVVVGGGTDCDGHTSNVSVTLIFSRLKDFVLTKGAHACVANQSCVAVTCVASCLLRLHTKQERSARKVDEGKS